MERTTGFEPATLTLAKVKRSGPLNSAFTPKPSPTCHSDVRTRLVDASYMREVGVLLGSLGS